MGKNKIRPSCEDNCGNHCPKKNKAAVKNIVSNIGDLKDKKILKKLKDHNISPCSECTAEVLKT